jgi:hypothetical protein
MTKRTAPPEVDHGLALLLDYDGRIEYLPGGYWMKFEIRLDRTSTERPHGLTYSFTLHESGNRRVIGFDNAHAVKPVGRSAKRQKAYDHWHQSAIDRGRPYVFTDAATLLADFFGAVEAYLAKHGYRLEVIGESTRDAALPRKRGRSS